MAPPMRELTGSRRRTRKLAQTGCLSVLAAALACYLGWGAWVSAVHMREERRASACTDRVMALSKAMLMYLADYGEAFPPAGVWSDRMAPYLPSAGDFVCPDTRGERCSYAFSGALGGLKVNAVQDPRATVVLFESDRGWNAAGGAELLPDRPRHSGGDRYAFADGHVEWLPRRHINAPGRPVGWAKEPTPVPGMRWVPTRAEPRGER